MCDFMFGSIRTSLPMDTVDVDLTKQMVNGIYMYRKDHMTESIIFTLQSKKVIPFLFFRCKIQAFQGDKRQVMALLSNDGSMFHFSALPKMPRNSKKDHWQN